jgi:ubiquitin-conjugating enzyme E2 D
MVRRGASSFLPNADGRVRMVSVGSGSSCPIEKADWSPAITLVRVARSLLSALERPDPDNPMRQEIANQFKTDRALFDKTAREWTQKYAT